MSVSWLINFGNYFVLYKKCILFLKRISLECIFNIFEILLSFSSSVMLYNQWLRKGETNFSYVFILRTVIWREHTLLMGFPGSSAGIESACNAGDLGWRPGFDPWVGKISWRRERLSTPVFWSGEFHGLYSPQGCKESDTTQWLSLNS